MSKIPRNDGKLTRTDGESRGWAVGLGKARRDSRTRSTSSEMVDSASERVIIPKKIKKIKKGGTMVTITSKDTLVDVESL